MNEFDITKFSDDEVISLYPKILKELKIEILLELII